MILVKVEGAVEVIRVFAAESPPFNLRHFQEHTGLEWLCSEWSPSVGELLEVARLGYIRHTRASALEQLGLNYRAFPLHYFLQELVRSLPFRSGSLSMVPEQSPSQTRVYVPRTFDHPSRRAIMRLVEKEGRDADEDKGGGLNQTASLH